jgi:hypothetical protein
MQAERRFHGWNPLGALAEHTPLVDHVRNRVENHLEQSTQPGERQGSVPKPRPLCLTQDASRPSTPNSNRAKINHPQRLSKRFLAPGTNVLQRKTAPGLRRAARCSSRSEECRGRPFEGYEIQLERLTTRTLKWARACPVIMISSPQVGMHHGVCISGVHKLISRHRENSVAGAFSDPPP